MEGTRQNRPVDIINQSQATNILDEHGELSQLIQDYFMDEPWDDSDEELSEEEEETTEEGNELDGNPTSYGEGYDVPLARIEPELSRVDCPGEVGACANYPTMSEATAF